MWVEQRTFVTQAPALLRDTYPALAANLTTALAELAAVVPPKREPGMGSIAPGDAFQVRKRILF